jgi:hypothetical protein
MASGGKWFTGEEESYDLVEKFRAEEEQFQSELRASLELVAKLTNFEKSAAKYDVAFSKASDLAAAEEEAKVAWEQAAAIDDANEHELEILATAWSNAADATRAAFAAFEPG